MVIDKEMVNDKLVLIQKMLADLAPYKGYQFLQYQQDKDAKYKVERIMHLLVECASDILNHVLADRGLAPAASYADTFQQAGIQNVLQVALADKLKASAKMRNRLVHMYSDIDDKIVFDAIKYFLEDFAEFGRQAKGLLT